VRKTLLTKKDLGTIQKQLSHYDQVREQVLTISRNAIRLAGSSILDIHRGQVASAGETIKQIEKILARIEDLSKDVPELATSQSVFVAFQEYTEAITLRSFAQTGKIPSLEEAGGDYRPYMLGLLDAIGELRRGALNALRKGEIPKAEKLLTGMEGIYDNLQTLEHTSIVPTFRAKMDASRRIIEATRGDVVTEVRRYSLEKALDRLEKRLGSSAKV
jgi:translin